MSGGGVFKFFFLVSDVRKRTVNVYLISSGLVKEGVSIRDQASKSYFYGKGEKGTIEFQDIEGVTADLFNRIEESGAPKIGSEDYDFLLLFVLTQLARTPYQVQKHMEAFDKMWTSP